MSECLLLSECFLVKSECDLSAECLTDSLECRTMSEFLLTSDLLEDTELISDVGRDGLVALSTLEDSGLDSTTLSSNFGLDSCLLTRAEWSLSLEKLFLISDISDSGLLAMLGLVSALGGVGFIFSDLISVGFGAALGSSSLLSENIPDFLLAFFLLNSSIHEGLESA